MLVELVTHLWQSTVFACAVGLLALALRRNRAAVRYWLWLSASLKFVVPFALLTSLGRQLRWTPAAHSVGMADISFVVERMSQPFPASLSFAAAPPGAVNRTALAILGAWVCGVIIVALIRVRCWLRIRAAVRASIQLEIPVAVEVRCAPGLLEPGVVGVLRPVLMLPEGIMQRLTPSQLEAVLAHELCHVRRHDNLFASIHMVVEGLFWFHPLVWWIGAGLIEERERACDEEVLKMGSEPRIYADAILNVCRLYVESRLACVAGVTGANLKRRIEAILTNRTGEGLSRTRRILLTSAAVIALTVPIAVGLLTGVRSAPVVHAQPPVARIPALTNPDAAGRLVAILIDFTSMSPEEQTRMRQSAIDYIHFRLGAADLVAIMNVDGDQPRIAQDFTSDKAVLESAIRQLSGNGSSSDGSRIAMLEAAAKLLADIPGKKALVNFFSGGFEENDANAQLVQQAIAEARKANVALYPIDARGLVPGGRSMAQQSPPAQAMLGSPSSAMGRTYARYGVPDQTDDRSSNVRYPVLIWRYNYLEKFHSSVEFEFMQGQPANVRINWPPPLATYQGISGVAAQGIVAGLPAGHVSFQIYPAGEFETLSVPLGSLTGPVDIVGQIGTTAGVNVASLQDRVQAATGTYQAKFILNEAGSYVCVLTVREATTGQTYGETINFEVK